MLRDVGEVRPVGMDVRTGFAVGLCAAAVHQDDLVATPPCLTDDPLSDEPRSAEY
jgi:hypothetical protein